MTNEIHAKDARFCLCGCKNVVGKKASYRPGHDAAHVSRLVALVVAEGMTQKSVTDAQKALPSDALKAKLQKAVDRLADKKAAKPGATAKVAKKPAPLTFNLAGGHLAKKGRWTYPVAEGSDGKIYRNAARDGSGEWILVTDADTIIDA